MDETRRVLRVIETEQQGDGEYVSIGVKPEVSDLVEALHAEGAEMVRCEVHGFAQELAYDPDVCPGGWDGETPCRMDSVLVVPLGEDA